MKNEGDYKNASIGGQLLLLFFLVQSFAAAGPAVHFHEGDNLSLRGSLGSSHDREADRNKLRSDLTSLFSSYKGYCVGLEITKTGTVYILMKNKLRLPYDDGKSKSFDEKLDNPDHDHIYG